MSAYDYTVQQLDILKNYNTAVFLGSGTSINRISKKQWKLIQQCDIWTVNNWVYHPMIVPDFYHVETKYYGYEILERRFKEKKELYKNVKFIFQKGKAIKVNGRPRPLRNVIPLDFNAYEYNMVKRDPKRTHRPFNANYKVDTTKLTKSYDMSITAIFELMCRMGYKNIVTFGIDLYDSNYFWTHGGKRFGEVHHQTNKEHEGKDSREPHNTFRIKDFLIDVNKRWMLPNKKRLWVGHEDTMLHPHLKMADLGKLI